MCVQQNKVAAQGVQLPQLIKIWKVKYCVCEFTEQLDLLISMSSQVLIFSILHSLGPGGREDSLDDADKYICWRKGQELRIIHYCCSQQLNSMRSNIESAEALSDALVSNCYLVILALRQTLNLKVQSSIDLKVFIMLTSPTLATIDGHTCMFMIFILSAEKFNFF